jgi:ketosteroid isomerase-like protein
VTTEEMQPEEHPHAALVREGYETFISGDPETLSATFHKDVVWHSAGRNWLVGDYKGLEAVMEFVTAIGIYSEGTYHNDLHMVFANDDHAVALHRSSAQRSDGRSMDVEAAVRFDFRDGKVAEVWAWPWDIYQEDEFYGAEPPPGQFVPRRS